MAYNALFIPITYNTRGTPSALHPSKSDTGTSLSFFSTNKGGFNPAYPSSEPSTRSHNHLSCTSKTKSQMYSHELSQ
ncbi:hypothetical protein LguiA_035874 [Lonicera macranthoides]